MEFDWLVALTFIVSLGTGALSGLSGGGGGFIIMPYYLLVVGLPPANALATAKTGGLGTVAGALAAFRGKGFVRKDLAYKFMAITLVCSIVAAWAIPRIDPEIFSRVIGAFLLLMIPTLLIKKASLQPGARSKKWIGAGYVTFTLVMLMSTMIGTGIGSLLLLVLLFMFGLNALESNATKRAAQVVQSVLLFILLAIQGLVMWWHAVAGLVGAGIGSHIGTHIAIKKGNEFVKIMLAIVMLTSGIALLI